MKYDYRWILYDKFPITQYKTNTVTNPPLVLWTENKVETDKTQMKFQYLMWLILESPK